MIARKLLNTRIPELQLQSGTEDLAKPLTATLLPLHIPKNITRNCKKTEMLPRSENDSIMKHIKCNFWTFSYTTTKSMSDSLTNTWAIVYATLVVHTEISLNTPSDTESHLDYQEYQGQPKLPKTLVAIWSQFGIFQLECNPIFCRYHHKPDNAQF